MKTSMQRNKSFSMLMMDVEKKASMLNAWVNRFRLRENS